MKELWQTDGTSGGTTKALSIPGEQIILFQALGDAIFVLTDDAMFHIHLYLFRWRPGEPTVPIALPFQSQVIWQNAPGLLLVLNGGNAGYQLLSIADCGDGLVRGGEQCDDHNITPATAAPPRARSRPPARATTGTRARWWTCAPRRARARGRWWGSRRRGRRWARR